MSDEGDGTPVSPKLDARMLADLREWRARLDTGPTIIALTIDELDMFLRRCAELEELRRELVDMPDDRFAPVPVRSIPFTAEIPDEVRERAAVLTSVCTLCGTPIERASATSTWYHRDGSRDFRKFGGGHHAEPRPEDAGEPRDSSERAAVLPAGHALIGGVVVPLPSKQAPLPFCNCGSVDKYGDDLGEHGPHCPYHLAVVGHVAAKTPPAVLDDLCRRTLAAQARLA